MAVGFAIASLVSAAVSADQQRRAAGVARERGRVETASQKTEAIRQRRAEARKARARKAQILQASELVGAEGSSAQLGASASIQSRLAGSQSFLRQREVTATAISGLAQKEADFKFRAGIASQVSDLFGQASAMNFGGNKPDMSGKKPTINGQDVDFN